MRQSVAGALAGLILAGPVGIAGAQTTAATAVASATLRVTGKEPMKVVVTAFDGTKLFYRSPSEPAGASISVPLSTVDRFTFDFVLDEEDLNRALMDQNWNRACVVLWPVISPVLPYMGIKNNNAVDLAMTLGNSLVKAAGLMKTGKEGDEEKAGRVIQRAYSVYAALTAAEWYQDADTARLKAILCLIALKNAKQAEKELKKIRVPDIGDQTLGLYWYAMAALREANGENRAAMNAVVKSIAFENKDIEIFPDALMMSGRLYEALLETHRARDVYYEVARLFPGTDWARSAKTRLEFIMDQKLTQSKEVIGIERTFFGLDEDVNAKVSALLKGTLDVDKPEAEENLDEEPDAEKPVAGGKEKGSGE